MTTCDGFVLFLVPLIPCSFLLSPFSWAWRCGWVLVGCRGGRSFLSLNIYFVSLCASSPLWAYAMMPFGVRHGMRGCDIMYDNQSGVETAFG